MSTFTEQFTIGVVDFAPDEKEDVDSARFMWWGAFVVITNKPTTIHPPFCIVDNLDDQGLVFLIKDTRIRRPILISWNERKNVYCSGVNFHELSCELKEFCDTVFVACNLVPLKLLKFK